MSVRSHSSGIMEDINKEYQELGKINTPIDASMKSDTHNDDNRSIRSRSNDSESKKRNIKSHIALAQKQKQLQQMNSEYGDEEEEFNETSEDQVPQIKNLELVTDEEAANIFRDLENEQSKKNY